MAGGAEPRRARLRDEVVGPICMPSGAGSVGPQRMIPNIGEAGPRVDVLRIESAGPSAKGSGAGGGGPGRAELLGEGGEPGSV